MQNQRQTAKYLLRIAKQIEKKQVEFNGIIREILQPFYDKMNASDSMLEVWDIQRQGEVAVRLCANDYILRFTDELERFKDLCNDKVFKISNQ